MEKEKIKSKHDGDCSIYSSLDNGFILDGICTCGYGHQLARKGDYSGRFSEERQQKLNEETITDLEQLANDEILGG